MLVKSYRTCFALSREAGEWNQQINTQAAGIIVVHSKYVREISQTIFRRHQQCAVCSAVCSAALMSQWWCVRAIRRAVKNAREQTSLFPMLLRFVFVISALANWRGKGGKQVRWKWSCKLIWQAPICELRAAYANQWMDCVTSGRALSHEQAAQHSTAAANQVA